MKVVILAGGFGTRLAELTHVIPKPMVEVGGKPMLWHIMKIYAQHGVREFVIALGYKGEEIKRHFLQYHHVTRDISIDLGTGRVETAAGDAEDWKIHLVDTGLNTMTGGRVRRLREWVGDDTFMVTYGDGVADVDVGALLAKHRETGRAATVTAVRPPARFGGLEFDGDRIARFTEKPQAGEGWINGGFLVFEPRIFDFLNDDATSLEADAMEALAAAGELSAYKHYGFWQCMDTLRDRQRLEKLWSDGEAPWKTW